MFPQLRHISPIYQFLLTFALLCLGWYLLYNFLIQPYTTLDMMVIDSTLWLSEGILEGMGHTTFVDGRLIRIAGTSGLWVGDNCNAISLFALFTGFIVSFPGQIKSKLWFIPLGIFIIFLVNALRVVFLAVIDTYSRKWTEFNHTYTFTILIYALIFGMWMFWVNRYSFYKKTTRLE